MTPATPPTPPPLDPTDRRIQDIMRRAAAGASLETPPRAPTLEFLSEESARLITDAEDGEPCIVHPDGSVTRGASLGDPLKPQAPVGLDQLHDEMANALMRFVQANQGLMGCAKKHEEGMDAKADIETWGEAMGNATALAEDVLRKYAAVASGELAPPPKSAPSAAARPGVTLPQALKIIEATLDGSETAGAPYDELRSLDRALREWGGKEMDASAYPGLAAAPGMDGEGGAK